MSSRRTAKLVLFGGFLLMILLTVVLGVGAIRISSNLIGLNSQLFNHPFTVSNTLRDIKLDILEIHREMTDIVATTNPREINVLVEEIDEQETRIFQRFAVIEERYLGPPADIAAARDAVVEWRDVRSEIIEMVRDGRRQEALAFERDGEDWQIDLMIGRIDRLIAFAHNKAAELRALGEAEHDWNMFILVALIGVVVITGGAVAMVVFFMLGRIERSTAEKEALYRQSQKMEAVGQLTGGLAHDLNNVLTIFSMNLGMLETKVADVPDATKHIGALKQGFTRAADLTRKLLDFSRTRMQEVKRVSVNEFVEGLESLIRKSLTPAIELRVALSPNAWAVDIDPGDLETALLNLSLNARDAMPQGGALVIETANKVIGEEYVAQNPGSSAGEFVLVSVSDTGHGMDAKTVAKAFEPFFTTKEVGSGTGLGLSMVYGFVQRSGGHVKIYSEPGEGTTIHLYLPRAEGAMAMETASGRPGSQPSGNGETVLVVDDERALAEAAVSFLESAGYRTVMATSGRTALEILRRDPSVDLLFTDVVMPGGMDGYQLALEALAERPGLRVLLTSGFTRLREQFVNGDRQVANSLARTLLSKPYSMAELAEAVHQALYPSEGGRGDPR